MFLLLIEQFQRFLNLTIRGNLLKALEEKEMDLEK